MSLINTTVKPFKAQAYHNGKFVEVTEANLKGKWAVFFFYPADFKHFAFANPDAPKGGSLSLVGWADEQHLDAPALDENAAA